MKENTIRLNELEITCITDVYSYDCPIECPKYGECDLLYNRTGGEETFCSRLDQQISKIEMTKKLQVNDIENKILLTLLNTYITSEGEYSNTAKEFIKRFRSIICTK